VAARFQADIFTPKAKIILGKDGFLVLRKTLNPISRNPKKVLGIYRYPCSAIGRALVGRNAAILNM